MKVNPIDIILRFSNGSELHLDRSKIISAMLEYQTNKRIFSIELDVTNSEFDMEVKQLTTPTGENTNETKDNHPRVLG